MTALTSSNIILVLLFLTLLTIGVGYWTDGDFKRRRLHRVCMTACLLLMIVAVLISAISAISTIHSITMRPA